MRATLAVIVFLSLATASAQKREESLPNGVIYGVAIGQDGRPAKRVILAAWPTGPLGTRLPHTRSNDLGEYRFENLPWWGKYTVLAEDDEAGYSIFSTGSARNEPSVAEITPAHREAEIKIYLPPKAGFLHINLTSSKTGAKISSLMVELMLPDSPSSPIYSIGCESSHTILVAPEKIVLLHVKSPGFHEWNESTGKGKLIQLASGASLTLDVQLDPSD
jgi:hypothetical protein